MERHRAVYEHSVVLSPLDGAAADPFLSYCRRMRSPMEWGGNTELQAAATALGLSIEIVSTQAIHIIRPPDDRPILQHLVVAHTAEVHYDSTRPLQEEVRRGSWQPKEKKKTSSGTADRVQVSQQCGRKRMHPEAGRMPSATPGKRRRSAMGPAVRKMATEILNEKELLEVGSPVATSGMCRIRTEIPVWLVQMGRHADMSDAESDAESDDALETSEGEDDDDPTPKRRRGQPARKGRRRRAVTGLRMVATVLGVLEDLADGVCSHVAAYSSTVERASWVALLFQEVARWMLANGNYAADSDQARRLRMLYATSISSYDLPRLVAARIHTFQRSEVAVICNVGLLRIGHVSVLRNGH